MTTCDHRRRDSEPRLTMSGRPAGRRKTTNDQVSRARAIWPWRREIPLIIGFVLLGACAAWLAAHSMRTASACGLPCQLHPGANGLHECIEQCVGCTTLGGSRSGKAAFTYASFPPARRFSAIAGDAFGHGRGCQAAMICARFPPPQRQVFTCLPHHVLPQWWSNTSVTLCVWVR